VFRLLLGLKCLTTALTLVPFTHADKLRQQSTAVTSCTVTELRTSLARTSSSRHWQWKLGFVSQQVASSKGSQSSQGRV